MIMSREFQRSCGMHEKRPVSQSTLSKRSNVDRATYTLAELAGLLGVSYTSAHEMAKAGELPVTPFRVGRKWLFPKSHVDKLLGIEAEQDVA